MSEDVIKIEVEKGKLEERWESLREKWKEQGARERTFFGKINRDKE